MTVVTSPEAFPHEFERALNAGDLERMVALYDEDAVIRGHADEIRSGVAAVRAEMQQLIEAGATITNALRLTFRHGRTALIIVDYVLRVTAPDGNPLVVNGTATNVIQESSERGWRLIVANPQGTA